VRLQLSRAESVKAGTKRNAFQIRMKTACDENGKLLAQQVDAIADGGAYASLSLGVIETAMEHACGPYLVPNIDARGRLVATNNGTCGAFRGFGCNEMTFAVESQIERLAQMVGIDAVTMRRQNIRQPGMPGYLGQKVAPTERLSAMLDSAAASPLWALPQGLSEDGQSWVGTGMALCYQGNGLGTLPQDEGEIELALAADGKNRGALRPG
jgi:CO/xanthine dehydrogenase Mo-binding subunit